MSGGGDAALIEASLVAVADAGVDIRLPLFERFLAAFPHRRAAFINLDAASRRMTDETLQMLFGLARGESWVGPQIADLVGNHRNYGALTFAEYDGFIDMTIAELARAVGPVWNADTAAAWRRQADALKMLVQRAQAGWASALTA